MDVEAMNTIQGPQFDISRKRAGKTTLFVVHWSGGEPTGTPLEQATKVYNTLVSRGDSVQYVCTSDGTIVQLADIDAHCVHGGSAVNDISVGIEVVCPGSALDVTANPARPTYQTKIHGAPVTYRGFLPAQIKAVAQLAQGVLWHYGIAYVSSPVCVEDTMPAGFEGVIGHYQVSSDKADPGPETMFLIRSRMLDQQILGGLLWTGVGEAVRRLFLSRM